MVQGDISWQDWNEAGTGMQAFTQYQNLVLSSWDNGQTVLSGKDLCWKQQSDQHHQHKYTSLCRDWVKNSTLLGNQKMITF